MKEIDPIDFFKKPGGQLPKLVDAFQISKNIYTKIRLTLAFASPPGGAPAAITGAPMATDFAEPTCHRREG